MDVYNCMQLKSAMTKADIYLNFRNSRRNTKKCDDDNNINKEEATSSLLHDDRTSIAVFHVYSPGLWYPAMCLVETTTAINNDDPLSLCLIGGLHAKISTFCLDYFWSCWAFSRRGLLRWSCWTFARGGLLACYGTVLGGLGIIGAETFAVRNNDDPEELAYFTYLFCTILCCLAVATGLWLRRYKKSTNYSNRKRDFWQSWNEFDLERELNQCGYYWETVDHKTNNDDDCRKFTVYKTESAMQSLPSPRAANDDTSNEEVVAQTLLRMYVPLEHRRCQYRSTSEEPNQGGDDPLVQAAAAVKVNDGSSFPVDFWTIRGLEMGIQLVMRDHVSKRGTYLFLLILVYLTLIVIATSSRTPNTEDFWETFLYIFVFPTLICLFEAYIVEPEYHPAFRDIALHLSPLIEDRHEGCSLHYETTGRVVVGWQRWTCLRWAEKGVFVLNESQPQHDVAPMEEDP